MKVSQLKKKILNQADPQKARILQGFFKTGKGQYGEGDKFLGLTVPQSRTIAKKFGDLKFNEIEKLLKSKFHEERLIALLILVHNFQKGDPRERKKIFNFYLKSKRYINNWDLVDLSAEKIVGQFLLDRSKTILYRLARSSNIWERRIAIVSTYQFIRNNKFDETLKITRLLLGDKHDLLHKASGWMLREVGKRDIKILENFLKTHYKKMPRTALRYAIERMPEKIRQSYLLGKI